MPALQQAAASADTQTPELPEPSTAATARQLCRHGQIKLRPEAEALLEEEMTPQAYFDRLLAQNLLPEARSVLAQAMPWRRALWWACLCALDAYPDRLPEGVARAVEVVVRFVHDPSEANRREAERIGQSLNGARLEGLLTLAAFTSWGSISLPHLPVVPAPPCATGRLVGGCVYLASVIRSPARYKNVMRQYLAIGLEIARGENLWYSGETQSARLDSGTASPVRAFRMHPATTHPFRPKPEVAADAPR